MRGRGVDVEQVGDAEQTSQTWEEEAGVRHAHRRASREREHTPAIEAGEQEKGRRSKEAGKTGIAAQHAASDSLHPHWPVEPSGFSG